MSSVSGSRGLGVGDVRGDVVNLLVRFRVMDMVPGTSVDTRPQPVWATVFPADCGDAHLVSKASSTRITLVTKGAWYLRVKLKSHSELPFAEGEEFLKVMSPD